MNKVGQSSSVISAASRGNYCGPTREQIFPSEGAKTMTPMTMTPMTMGAFIFFGDGKGLKLEYLII